MDMKSKMSASLFRPLIKRNISGCLKTAYFMCGVVGIASLCLALTGKYSLGCLLCSSAGIFGMVGIGIFIEQKYNNENKKHVISQGFLRDILIGLIWIGAMILWIRNPL